MRQNLNPAARSFAPVRVRRFVPRHQVQPQPVQAVQPQPVQAVQPVQPAVQPVQPAVQPVQPRKHSYPQNRVSKSKLVPLPENLASVKEIDVVDVTDDQTAYFVGIAQNLRSLGWTKCASYMTAMICAVWQFGRVTNSALMQLLDLDPRDMNSTLNGKKSLFQGMCFDKHGDSKYHALYGVVQFKDVYELASWVTQVIKASGR